jgi:hypothetical protein
VGLKTPKLAWNSITVWINRLESPLLTASYLVLLAYVLASPLLFLGHEYGYLLRDGAVVALAMGAFATILCSCFYAAYYPEHGAPFMGVLVICVVFTTSNFKRILDYFGSATRADNKTAVRMR